MCNPKMYACKKCYQVFDVKPSKHGRARKPSRTLIYLPCDGEVVEAEVLEEEQKKSKRYLFQFLA
jgi:hypothetical protein